MGNSLEYEEDDLDDLFGDYDNVPGFVDERKPVAQSRPLYAPAPSPPPALPPLRPGRWPTINQRLSELIQSRHQPSPPPSRGVDSLRSYTMLVVRANSSRIWDIGGLEYFQVAEMLDELPREQLGEIEVVSPQIAKDTDWLWEIFMLQEFPLFHERCREKQGEPRTSGWRRMFAKAQKDAEERKAQALSRVAERYAEMDAQRASKKIVVLNEFVAPNKGHKSHSLSTARRGHRAAAPYTPPTKAQSAIAKARVDAQRARVALTHSSGKYIPPPASKGRNTNNGGDLYNNPYLNPGSASTSQSTSRRASPIPGPRLPPPRVPRRDVLPGAYPSGQPNAHRAALPQHLKPQASSSTRRNEASTQVSPRGMAEIHKPAVDNFVPAKPAKKRIDFFGGSGSQSKRPRVETQVVKVRKAREPASDGDSSTFAASSSSLAPASTSATVSSRTTPSGSSASRPTPPRKPIGAAALFVKKKRPPPR